MKFDFEPTKLKSLVTLLEQKIGRKTGEPIRLDTEKLFKALRDYDSNPIDQNIPSINKLERLTGFLDRVKTENLFISLLKCVKNRPSSLSHSNFLAHYFDNFELEELRSYLRENVNRIPLSHQAWEKWSEYSGSYFGNDPVTALTELFITKGVDLLKIPEYSGIQKGTPIIRAVQTKIFHEKFEEYLAQMPYPKILDLLNDNEYNFAHKKTWSIMLPQSKNEAIQDSSQQNSQNKMFKLAKAKLGNPNLSENGSKWLNISNDAVKAYLDWAFGKSIESFFRGDGDRSRYWKNQLRHMTNVQEVYKRNELIGCFIQIGGLIFLEFKEIGAIYVYREGDIRVTRNISNERKIKIRDKVFNYGGVSNMRTQTNEGWIPHYKNWKSKANQMIQIAKNL